MVERYERRPFAPREVLVELDYVDCIHDDTSKNVIEQGQRTEAVLGSAG
jgi:hypothetical protein